MLEWKRLLNPVRRKELRGSTESMNTGVGRQEIERDYDRILFATPTRRLANKTQVFPLEENIAIRNRLTHSHEVSNLARSIGVRIAFDHAEQVFGDEHESLNVKRNAPALLAAVGLAHDLGNPPFGHQGEVAIREWFSDNGKDTEEHDDFLHFDGNAQTFRLLTQLQVLNDDFGLNLTVATLAALMKYPSLHDSKDKGGFNSSFGIQNDGKSLHHRYHSNSSRMVNTSNWRLRAKKIFTLSSNAVMRVSAQHPKASPSSSSVSEIIARNRCHSRPAKLNAFNRSCISARTSPMRALSHSNFA